jgi:hypothetical protein
MLKYFSLAIAGMIFAFCITYGKYTSAQPTPNCFKQCGKCDDVWEWERDCTSDPLDPGLCYVTLCETLKPSCGYNGAFNDWCEGAYYCEDGGNCLLD